MQICCLLSICWQRRKWWAGMRQSLHIWRMIQGQWHQEPFSSAKVQPLKNSIWRMRSGQVLWLMFLKYNMKQRPRCRVWLWRISVKPCRRWLRCISTKHGRNWRSSVLAVQRENPHLLIIWKPLWMIIWQPQGAKKVLFYHPSTYTMVWFDRNPILQHRNRWNYMSICAMR